METAKRSEKKTILNRNKEGSPIVGIGASAGGLEAITAILQQLQINTGLVFVIIQHLAAGQESMLPSILARATKMPVYAVTNEMQVEPNTVYVIPSGKIMTLDGEYLKLIPKGASLRPIDAFFDSIAHQRKTQAIGIVLSGTGTDGTEGLKEIKNEGGITIAQDPKTAQYTGMPQSAISAETVELVLSPDQIAEELSKIASNPQLIRTEIEAAETKSETVLGSFFSLLKHNFKVDFSHYKEAFLNRRIKRRMVLNNIDNVSDYSDYVLKHPNELQKLFDDLLVGVTNFFREPSTFALLKEKVFPELVKDKTAQQSIRVWVIGCSSGEEAYSLAIALLEFLEEKKLTSIPIQVFGTDVNQKNIDKARQGIYPKNIEANVSEERLKKYFNNFDSGYRISKDIRELCVFSKQDVTADPPFSNLDLVSCRNILIYFDSQLQERVIPILHYALKPNGFLVLGESESIGKLTTLFEPQTAKGIVYVRKTAHPQVAFGFETFAAQEKGVAPLPGRKEPVSLIREQIDKLLLTDYVPASLLANNNLDVIITRGNVAPYIKLESGEASLNLAKVLRREVRATVQTLIYKAKKENKPTREEAIRFDYQSQPLTANIKVTPIKLTQYEKPFFLVLFEDVSSAAAHLRQAIELTSTPEGRENAKDHQILELREEADSAKQGFQSIIESQETTNEELKASMEELQSTSEELQSTNEELETAKEELQSSNEELTTLNDELKNRNQTIALLNADLTNVSENVDSPVVLVDRNLKIRLFNPAAEKILNLIPGQIGLPIASVSMAINVEDLEKILLDVIATNGKFAREVSDKTGRVFELRVRPYFIEKDRIDGAVLAFSDITERKTQDEREIESIAKFPFENPNPVFRVKGKGKILYGNPAGDYLLAEWKSKVGERVPKHVGQIAAEALTSNKKIEIEEVYGSNIFSFLFVPITSEGYVNIYANDITDRKKAEDLLVRAKKQSELDRKHLEDILATIPSAVVIVEASGEFSYLNKRALSLYGINYAGFDLNAHIAKVKALKSDGTPFPLEEMPVSLSLKLGREIRDVEMTIQNVIGVRLPVLVSSAPLRDSQGKVVSAVVTFEDVTERKKAEEALKESEQRYRALFSNMDEAFFLGEPILDRKGNPVDYRILEANRAFEKQSGLKLSDLLGKTIKEALPGLEEVWVQNYCKVALTGESIRFVNYNQNTQRYYEVYAFSPNKGQFASLFTDITERKKAEDKIKVYQTNLEKLVEERTKKLELSSLYARNLIEASLDPLVTISADGKITDVNKATEQVTGCSRKQLIGSDFSDYFTEPEKAEVGYKRVFTRGFVRDYPLAIKDKSGKVTEVLYNATVYRNDAGEIQGVFAAARDITEQKKAEEKAQEAAKKLKDSERLAAIGATAGMVGHDIRNPLQAISGDVYLLKSELDSMLEGEAKENAAESLQGIEQNVDYINKIVQDLQDYARPLNPKIEESDLKSIIETFIAKNGLPKNVKLIMKITDEARKIRADSYYLNRILFNLVNNAVQAMPNGGTLTIDAHKEANDTILAVKDTGVGIPREIHDKMFTLMFTTKAKGQGFGLPVVKRMTESLGGTVTFESQEGKGTTFIVCLPPKNGKR